MANTSAPSLRERKRLATWAALHEAALRMALCRDGLHQVTVEEIAEAANVSPRTFFNYFNCKEDAVLGIHEPAIDEATATWFADTGDDDLLESVARLLFEVAYGGSLGVGEARQRRRTALLRHPELSQRQIAHIVKAEQLVSQVVADWLGRSPRWQAEPVGADLDQAAYMIVMVAGTAMRTAIRQLTAASTDDERVALDHAISLLREITRKI